MLQYLTLSGSWRQGPKFLFDGTDQFLDRIDLLFLKVGSAAACVHHRSCLNCLE